MPSLACESSGPPGMLTAANLPCSLPSRWNDADIVVNDAVIIKPPYSVDDLKAPSGKEQSVASVRRILDMHYQRKKNAGARAPVATPIAPRKGG